LLHLTLLRTVRYTESNHGGGDDFAAYGKEPEIFDLGRRIIRYAFGMTHPNGSHQTQPAAVAETLYTPAVEVAGGTTAGPIEGFWAGDSLVPAWVRPAAGGGLLLRFHETLGKRGMMRLGCRDGWHGQVVNMDGSEVAGGQNAKVVRVPFGPYKVLSVLLRRD
jgi:alpha-mannosidase